MRLLERMAEFPTSTLFPGQRGKASMWAPPPEAAALRAGCVCTGPHQRAVLVHVFHASPPGQGDKPGAAPQGELEPPSPW